jgi:valyl-tRNA synthetase
LPTWFNQPFSEELLRVPKNELSILYNTIAYAKTYLELLGYKKSHPTKLDDYSLWIKSRLAKTIKSATDNLNSHYHREAVEAIKNFFINDFSRTYIKLIRPKLKKNYEGSDKESTMQTLYDVGLTVLKLMSPFTPFLTEELYQSFYAKYENEKSIHLISWPEYSLKDIDDLLEKEFDEALDMVESLLNIRVKENLKIRWPLKSAAVLIHLRKSMLEMIGFLTNIKEIKSVKKAPKGFLGKEKAFLNISANASLKNEALLSELLRAIQDYRKQKKFNVGDVKKVTIKTIDKNLIKIINDNIDLIKESTDSEVSIKNEHAEDLTLLAWDKKCLMGFE